MEYKIFIISQTLLLYLTFCLWRTDTPVNKVCKILIGLQGLFGAYLVFKMF